VNWLKKLFAPRTWEWHFHYESPTKFEIQLTPSGLRDLDALALSRGTDRREAIEHLLNLGQSVYTTLKTPGGEVYIKAGADKQLERIVLGKPKLSVVR
jgi:hypothetical protein